MLNEFTDHRSVSQNIHNAKIGNADDANAYLVGKHCHLVHQGIGHPQASGLECGGSRADKTCGRTSHQISGCSSRYDNWRPRFCCHPLHHGCMIGGSRRGLKTDIVAGQMHQSCRSQHGRKDSPNLTLPASGKKSKERFLPR